MSKKMLGQALSIASELVRHTDVTFICGTAAQGECMRKLVNDVLMLHTGCVAAASRFTVKVMIPVPRTEEKPAHKSTMRRVK